MEKLVMENMVRGFVQVRALLLSAQDSGTKGWLPPCPLLTDTGGIQMRL